MIVAATIGNPFEGLESLHLHGPRRAAQVFADLFFKLRLARFVVIERIEVSLERDLLRRMKELPVTQPPAVPRAPRFAVERQVAPEQKCLNADTVPPDVLEAACRARTRSLSASCNESGTQT